MIVFRPGEIITRLYRGVGEFLRRKAVKNIQEISYGYQQKYKGRLRWVSKRGEPANRMTGAMQRSIHKGFEGKHAIFVRAGGPVAPYTKIVEVENGKDRPNLRELMSKNRNEVRRGVVHSISSVLREKVNEFNRK